MYLLFRFWTRYRSFLTGPSFFEGGVRLCSSHTSFPLSSGEREPSHTIQHFPEVEFFRPSSNFTFIHISDRWSIFEWKRENVLAEMNLIRGPQWSWWAGFLYRHASHVIFHLRKKINQKVQSVTFMLWFLSRFITSRLV